MENFSELFSLNVEEQLNKILVDELSASINRSIITKIVDIGLRKEKMKAIMKIIDRELRIKKLNQLMNDIS